MTVAADTPVDDRYLTSGREAGTAPGDRRFRPDVQGLRAVAVLLVVLFHAGWQPLGGGYVGVDVFFVISGFVITGVLLRERSSSDRTSILAFYGRRCRRIIPAATLVILATVTLAYLVLGVVYGGQTAIDGRWAAVFLANFHFASEGTNYLSAQQPPSLLQNFWSLAVEEQFYLVYPTFFVVLATIPTKLSLRARLAIGLSGVIVVSYIISIVQTGSSPTVAFFSPLTRAWELALGALVAVSTEWLLRIPARLGSVLTWVGLGAIGFAAFSFTAATPYPGSLAIVPVLGTALVIAAGSSVPRHGAESLLRLPPFQWLGMLSYSLYLWHWPILILAADHAGQSSLPFRQNVVWLFVALAASVVTYYVVENPLRRGKLPVSGRWAPVALGVVLVLVSVGVITLQIQAHSDAGSATPPPAPTVSPSSVPAGTTSPVAQVEAAVRAASRIRSLPANLNPPLDKAASDWGGPAGACFPALGVSTVPSCVFGDPHGTRTVVLYGDSHAAMWADVIGSIAQYAGWKLVVLSKGDCPADMLPYENPSGWGSPGGEFSVCDKWHRFAIARIRQIHPDLVIISQEIRGSAHGTSYSPDQWNHGLQDAMDQLRVPTSHIVILGNIPVLPESGPQCLSRNPHDVQKCSGPSGRVQQQYIRAEAAAAAQSGARYINVTPWFCSTTCTAVIKNNVVYFDQFHITAVYSFFLEGALAQALLFSSSPS
jgi:peptidoglycan/LPS O-acetylase OafA/YrhL